VTDRGNLSPRVSRMTAAKAPQPVASPFEARDSPHRVGVLEPLQRGSKTHRTLMPSMVLPSLEIAVNRIVIEYKRDENVSGVTGVDGTLPSCGGR
jgi:hypothetical protein